MVVRAAVVFDTMERIDVVPEQLHDQLGEIPGVASAEVSLRDDAPPLARVWLDGTRTADEVRERVQALLGSYVPTIDAPPRKARRSGLGRGLGDVIEADVGSPEPTHLVPSEPKPVEPARIARVGVVETADGVHVEVEDTDGNRQTGAVGVDGSIDAALVDAMAPLLEIPADALVSIDDVVTDEGDVVLATIVSHDDERHIGAAYVEFGRPWALARAVAQAASD